MNPLYIIGGAAVFVVIVVWVARTNAKQQAWVDAIRREGTPMRGRVVDLLELRRQRNASFFSVRLGVAVDDPERTVWLDGRISDVLTSTTLRIGAEVPVRVRGNDAIIEGSDVRASRALIGGSFPWAKGMVEGHHETK